MEKISLKGIFLFLVVFCVFGAMTSLSQGISPDNECGCEDAPLPEILATVNELKLTKTDFSQTTITQINRLQEQVIGARKAELNLIINSKLLDAEAKRQGIATSKLIEQEVIQKVKEPTEAEALAFYDQNKTAIGFDYDTMKSRVVSYIREKRQQEAAQDFTKRLREAAEVKMLVEYATPPKTPNERSRIFAYVNSEPITSGDVEDNLKPLIFSAQEQIYNLRKNDLDLKINDALLEQEAKKRNLSTRALLDAEVNRKAPTITEAQAQDFYNENKNRLNGEFTNLKTQIIRYLTERENGKATQAFAAQLRNTATIQIFLTAPVPPTYIIPTDDQPIKGASSATVTIVEFIDFQCPKCPEIHAILDKLTGEYAGKVKLVVLDYPLSQHTEAFKAAEAAEAAREQGKYWEYANILLRNQSALQINNLKEYATRLNLNSQKFDAALDTNKFTDHVQRDLLQGAKVGINSTPAIFVNGKKVSENSYEALKTAVESEIKEQK